MGKGSSHVEPGEKQQYGAEFDAFMERATAGIKDDIEKAKKREHSKLVSERKKQIKSVLAASEIDDSDNREIIGPEGKQPPIVAIRDGQELTDKNARPRTGVEGGAKEEDLQKQVSSTELKMHDRLEVVNPDGVFRGINLDPKNEDDDQAEEHPLSQLAGKEIEFLRRRNNEVIISVIGTVRVELIVDLETFESCFSKQAESKKKPVGVDSLANWEESIDDPVFNKYDGGKAAVDQPEVGPTIDAPAAEVREVVEEVPEAVVKVDGQLEAAVAAEAEAEGVQLPQTDADADQVVDLGSKPAPDVSLPERHSVFIKSGEGDANADAARSLEDAVTTAGGEIDETGEST